MSGINPPIRDLRVMWVYTPKHEFVIQFSQEIQHSLAEETGAGAEILGGLQLRKRGIGLLEERFDGLDLRAEFVVGERAGGLIMHSVIR